MSNDPKPKRKMSIASYCAMTCAEGGFHRFLNEKYGRQIMTVDNPGYAAVIVTAFCRAESRKEFNEPGPAQDNWFALNAEYKAWLRT